MNYNKLYNTIIEKRKIEIPTGYTEEHHIVPRSLGGGNDKSNLVLLTAKEHFICHLLLTKMYDKDSLEYYKMCHAFMLMLIKSKNQERYITSRKYEHLKVSFSERMSALQRGKNNSQYGMMWIHNKTLKQCKKVPKESIIEDGWETGRVINFNFLNDSCIKCGIKLHKQQRNKIKYCNLCRCEIDKSINHKKIKESISKPVIDDLGNYFNTQTECAKFHNISEGGVRYRIKTQRYKQCH